MEAATVRKRLPGYFSVLRVNKCKTSSRSITCPATKRLHVALDSDNMQPGGCMNTDRIEKKILLHAPLKRVWRALSDSTEFGTWFGVKFEDPFSPGVTVRGVIVTTKVNAEVAKAQKPHEGMPFEITIEQME